MMTKTQWIVRLCVLSLFGLNILVDVQAETIKPIGDITSIQMDGIEVSMLNTIIDTNNAHPIEILNFFVPNSKGIATQLSFEMNDDYVPYLPLRSGADCAISGARTIKNDKQLRLIYATRSGGWTEKKIVTFSIFELTKNDSGLPGTPDIYFKKVKTVNTKLSYCDVNAALDKEPKLYQ